MTMNKSTPASFALFFPLVPETESIGEQKNFTLYITGTVLPSLTINPLEIPWQGGKAFGEGGGLEFGNWNTNFVIDDEWKSYEFIYNWLININNGVDLFGRKNWDYQITATLSVLDNYENPVVDFTFANIWPSALGEVSLSYQEGESYLNTEVTFTYDYFYKN